MCLAVVVSIFLTAFLLASLPRCVNVGGQEVCPYFAVYRMNDAVHREGFGTLLVSKALDSTCVLLLNDVFYYSFGFVWYFYPQIYIGFIDTSLESPVCKLLLNDVGFFVAIFYY